MNFCFTCTYTCRAFFSIDPDPDFVPIRIWIRTQEKKSDPDLDPYSGKKSPIRIRTKGPGSKTVVFILLTNVIDFTSYDGFALFVLLLFSRPGKIHKEVPYAGHRMQL